MLLLFFLKYVLYLCMGKKKCLTLPSKKVSENKKNKQYKPIKCRNYDSIAFSRQYWYAGTDYYHADCAAPVRQSTCIIGIIS